MIASCGSWTDASRSLTRPKEVTYVSQGESAVLAAGKPFRLVFPQLTIYLAVEPVTG